MIRVLFFAGVRERLGVESIEVEAADAGEDTRSLRLFLAARGGVWVAALGEGERILVAVNQELTSLDTALADGDEIAFFPPVTGG